MASLDSITRNNFSRDFSIAQQEVQHGVTVKRSKADNNMWHRWCAYCESLGLDSLLSNISDPVPIVQVFARRLRSGVLAPRGEQIRHKSVEGYLRAVGQTFAAVGAPDPRQTWQGNIDFRIQRQLAHYKKEDPPPHRVKPLPVQVLRRIMGVALAAPHLPGNNAIADMITLAFFFLLRPGEYTASTSESSPFRLCDVRLKSGGATLDSQTCPASQLLSATFATLEFTNQKNGVRGEIIGLSKTSDPALCPVKALARRLIHLRHHNAPPTSPLAKYFANQQWQSILPSHITTTIKQAVRFLGPSSLGFTPNQVSARSLRAAGAMALFNARVDPLTIRLVGRWRSDEMLRYLHVQAEPVMRGLSQAMVASASYRLHHDDVVPSY